MISEISTSAIAPAVVALFTLAVGHGAPPLPSDGMRVSNPTETPTASTLVASAPETPMKSHVSGRAELDRTQSRAGGGANPTRPPASVTADAATDNTRNRRSVETKAEGDGPAGLGWESEQLIGAECGSGATAATVCFAVDLAGAG